MPQVFRIGSYWVYFWTNEGEPIEPVHVHVSEGSPSSGATKVWITRAGKCLVAHNDSHIPAHTLRNICRIIESRSGDVVAKWREYFGNVSFYC